MPADVWIRNLTSQDLVLSTVEETELSGALQRRKRRLAGLDCVKPGLCIGSEDYSEDEDADSDERLHIASSSFPSVRQDVQVQLKPFTTVHTSVQIDTSSSLLKFVFQNVDGATYDLDFSLVLDTGEEFISNRNTRPNLSGLYFHNSKLLTLLSKTNPARWMANYPDQTPLESLSIPGTHNSPTHFRALPSVRCQAVSVREQLDNGIRFLDFRLQVNEVDDQTSDKLSVVHSVFPISLSGSKKFRPFYEEIVDFLNRHPSETIILSLKREGTGKGTDDILAQRLHDHYIDERHWVTAPGVPVLGEARGKIVLLRRFWLGERSRTLSRKIHGISAHIWADNSPNSKAGNVHVQDFYEVLHTENIDKKIQYVHEHCARVGAASEQHNVRSSGTSGPLFLNFLSASNFWKTGCWPEKIAAKINPAMARYLCEQHDVRCSPNSRPRGTGVVVCDWAGENGDWDLVRIIVAMNENLLMCESSGS